MATASTGWKCTHSASVISQTNTTATIRVTAYWTNDGWEYNINYVSAWVYCNGVKQLVKDSGNVTAQSSGTQSVSLGYYDYTINKTTAKQNISCKAKITSESSYVSGSKYSTEATVAVSAKPSYTITYNANGGSGAPSSQTKWYGTNLTLSTVKPTRTGYTFNGWATSSTGSVAYQPGATYTANSAITLYAKWTANTYSITYNANGGTGAPASQTKTYGVDFKLSSTKPIRTNYNFLGWATSANGGVAYAAGATYKANSAVTLYAVWELAYVKPRITNFAAQRCDSAGATNEQGTYVKVDFKWVTDKTVIEIKIEWKTLTAETWSSTTVTATGTSGTVSKIVGEGKLSSETSYIIRAYVKDLATDGTTYSPQLTIGTAKYPIDVYAKGEGVAFGKAAEEKDLADFAYKVKLGGGLTPVFLEAETNLDNVRTPNFYTGKNVASNNYTNCPISSGTFYLEVVSMGSDGQVRQKITSCDKDNAIAYERYYYQSVWGDWHNSSFGVANVSSVGDDLNNYTTTGTYLFGTSSNPVNGPTNVNNGWLVVMAISATIVKQIWYRIGSNNTNDFQTYVRTCNTGSWSKWKRYSNDPVTLYDNTSGTNGTVTLSETAANFAYLEIFYAKGTDKTCYKSEKIHSPNGKSVSLITGYWSSNDLVLLYSKTVTISGTSITIVGHGRLSIDGSGGSAIANSTNYIYIYKVLGYK